MRKTYYLLLVTLLFPIGLYAQKARFDSKYIKVGVLSNEWPEDFKNNPNIRHLGTQGINFYGSGKDIEKELNNGQYGKRVLDLLFMRDAGGLHMDRLYAEALNNTTVEEIETALLDASAETKDVLKREIAHQLLKNNYIVIFQTFKKKEKIKQKWYVFHVDIDDKIIDQAYSNWRTPETYDMINVPIKYVAEGNINKRTKKNHELVYDIAKKVSAFAVRGPVTSRFPFISRIGSSQDIRNSSRIYVYRMKADNDGILYSKKICTTRATDVFVDSTRMFSISGTFPSMKKGDVAVLRDHHHGSFSVMGQLSLGDDKRIGGRLQHETLLHFSKTGIAQYFLTSLGYNKYEEKRGVWYDGMENVKPTLHNAEFTIGYGFGLNAFGRLEIMPYLMGGYQFSFVTGGRSFAYWDSSSNEWDVINEKREDQFLSGHGVVGYAGIKLSLNLWYPVQLTGGADYNFSTKSHKISPIQSKHDINRLNLYAGIRIHL